MGIRKGSIIDCKKGEDGRRYFVIADDIYGFHTHLTPADELMAKSPSAFYDSMAECVLTGGRGNGE